MIGSGRDARHATASANERMSAAAYVRAGIEPANRSEPRRSVCERKESVRGGSAYATVMLRRREWRDNARGNGKCRNARKRSSQWSCSAASDARASAAVLRRRIMLVAHLMRRVACARVPAVFRAGVQHPGIAQNQGEPESEQRAQ